MIFLNTTFANELASSAYVSADMNTLVFNTAGGVSTAEKKKDYPTTPAINLAWIFLLLLVVVEVVVVVISIPLLLKCEVR